MSRLPRVCLPGVPQHTIQRSSNRQICFASNKGYAAYMRWLVYAAKLPNGNTRLEFYDQSRASAGNVGNARWLLEDDAGRRSPLSPLL